MTKRRALWLLVAVAGLAVAGLLIPGSPAYLPNFYNPPPMHGGHSSRYWIDALDDPDLNVRHRAIFALGTLGPEAEQAVPALARILTEDPDIEARLQASLALSKLRIGSPAVISALAQALEDRDSAVRLNAAMGLFRLGTGARPAIPALVRAMRDDGNRQRVGRFDFSIREIAIRALGRTGAGSAEAVAALLEALTVYADRGARMATAWALGEVGPEARSALPRLRKMLDNDDEEMRLTVAGALRKIESRPAEGKD